MSGLNLLGSGLSITGSAVASSLVVPGGTAITGGTDKRVLFDDVGFIGESADFTFDKVAKRLTLGGPLTTGAGNNNIGGSLILSVGNVTIPAGNQFQWLSQTFMLSPATGTISFRDNGAVATVSLFARADNNLGLGLADAAAPVAQTLSAQGVVAGTLNTASPSLIIQSGASTGNVNGGTILFKVSQAGGSGTAQNAPVTQLQVGAGSVTAFGAVVSSGDGRFVAASGTVMNLSTDGTARFSNSANTNSTTISFPTATATPTFQFGALDAAAPVAQIISTQSVVAGTSNTAGVSTTHTASRGAGTGVGGDWVVQVAPAGSTGSTPNTLVDGLRLKGTGSVVLGNAALATNATDGFLYIPTCAGTPTGVPTAFTGRIAMIYDMTNHQFWFYEGGAWKQPKTPAGAAIVTWQ